MTTTTTTTPTGPTTAELPVKESQISAVHSSGKSMLMKVTDYDYGNINPSPIKLHKDMELLEEFLSPRKLQAMTGVENLDTVEFLEMRVNTDQMSLGNFGMYVPNLTEIKLSGSYIPTIRDLGTSLWNLQVLWMPQCCLRCLDGLVTMSSMRELYLAYNEIDDISSCGMLENLEILDLEGNRIEDTGDLHYLSMCSHLSRLTLEGNPLCNPAKYAATAGATSYRRVVRDLVPQLDYLEDVPCSSTSADSGYGDESAPGSGSTPASAGLLMQFEDHWNFINAMLVESGLLAESARSQDESGSMSSTPADSGRPVSSTRPGSGTHRRLVPGTATATGRRPLTGGLDDPSGGGGDNGPMADDQYVLGDSSKLDDSSLTAGPLVCGSITHSLRRRPEEQTRCKTATKPAVVPQRARYSLANLNSHDQNRPQDRGAMTARDRSDHGELDIDQSCEAVLEQLGQWRRDYEISRARIERTKVAQVLTIECEEDEIEHVVMATPSTSCKSKSSKTSLPHLAPVTTSPVDGASGTKKLNPLRIGAGTVAKQRDVPYKSAGRLPPPSAVMSRLTASHALADEECPSVSVVTEKPPPSSTSQTMSRMRRQLLESCALTSIAPSKPLLKR